MIFSVSLVFLFFLFDRDETLCLELYGWELVRCFIFLVVYLGSWVVFIFCICVVVSGGVISYFLGYGFVAFYILTYMSFRNIIVSYKKLVYFWDEGREFRRI